MRSKVGNPAARLVVGVAVAMLAVRCSDSSSTITRPTPTLPAPSPAPAPLNGVVLDDTGMPVSGAKVSISGAGGSSSATTNASGSYQLSATVPLFAGNLVSVRVAKSGFEDTYQDAMVQGSSVQSLRLYPIITRTAGDQLHFSLTSDNSLCGIDDEYRYRRIHVAASSSGTLELDAIADDPANSFQLVVEDALCDTPAGGSGHLSVLIDAGSMITLDVVHPWRITEPLGVTLKTALVR